MGLRVKIVHSTPLDYLIAPIFKLSNNDHSPIFILKGIKAVRQINNKKHKNFDIM